MAKNTPKQDEEVLVDVTSSLSKLENFFEENSQKITIAIVAIFAVAGGLWAYHNFYKQPREEKAQQAIFKAQMLFEKDSLNEAVNGVGENMGFLDVADSYGNTKAGNLAHYYAGVSYLKLGQYENSIQMLDEFKTDDPILGVLALTNIGDAFLELGQQEEALEYYTKATRFSDNSFAVPFALHKAGMLAESMGKNEKAKDFYSRIKNDFPDSRQATNIDMWIARAQAASKE